MALRRVPGELCLSCESAWVPLVEPSGALAAEIEACVAGAPCALTVLKAFGVERLERRCDVCGEGLERARLDVGVGQNGAITLRDVPGVWCWGCGSAFFDELGREIRARLSRIDLRRITCVQPSLLYDTRSHPTSLQLEVTTRCNLKCAYCSHQLLENKRDASLDYLLRVLDGIDLRCVDNVDFTGLGEATLHQKLAQFVSEILRRGSPSDVRLVTNGTALTPKVARPLAEAGITSFAFSIDSMDPARFARARGGARLHQVLENLGALVALRNDMGDRFRIKIKAVLTENAFEEADLLLCHSAKLDIEMPQFARLDMRDSAVGGYTADWLKDPFESGSDAAFSQWLAQRWSELGGRPLHAENARPGTAAERFCGYHNPLLEPRGLCRWAIDAAYIAEGGSLLSCCEQMIDRPRRYWGELERRSMTELWTEELFWGYRLPLSLGLLPTGCVGCAYAPRHGRALPSAAPAKKSLPILGGVG